MLDFVIAALEEFVDYLLYKMLEEMYKTWENAAGSFNPGQSVIYINNIQGALEDFANDAASDWPWIDAEMYIVYVQESYDIQVMERAFSDVTMKPVDKMEEIIAMAQQVQEKVYMLEAINAVLG